MEFTQPKVAQQLLEEMEEKEEQLRLAAEFGHTLLVRTEELSEEKEATERALEAARQELERQKADTEGRARAEAELEAMRLKMEAMEAQLRHGAEEGVPPEAPPQLQALIAILAGLTARPAGFATAMRAAALGLMQRADEVDAGELARALESCGAASAKEHERVSDACAFLLRQALKQGGGAKQLGPRLRPMGFSDELIDTVCETCAFVRDSQQLSKSVSAGRSFQQASTVDEAASARSTAISELAKAVAAQVRVDDATPDDLASPHPIAMPEPEPEPEPDDDEDDDQDGADEDELVVVTEQDREAFAAMMAEREAKLKAQLDRVARVDDSEMQPRDGGPWSTEEVLRATKYPLLEAALKLLEKHWAAEAITADEVDALEGLSLHLWEKGCEDADETMLPLLTRWLQTTVADAVEEASNTGRADAPPGLEPQLTELGLEKMAVGAIVRCEIQTTIAQTGLTGLL